MGSWVFGRAVPWAQLSGFPKTSLLLIYAAYLILGDLARPGVYYVASGGLPVIEVVLVLVAGIGILFLRPRIPSEFVLVTASILISSVIGYLSHGMVSVLPAARALRLVAILLGSVVIAHVMHEKWGNNPTLALRFFTIIFLAQTALGWVLLIVFPNAQELLEAMRAIGLYFHGEPHQYRMLGPVLEPNYFGNLLVLAIAIAAGLTVASGISWTIVAYGLFIASLIYTLSRSSVIGMAIWCGTYALLQIKHRRRFLSLWKIHTLLIIVAVATGALLHEQVSTIMNRIATIPSDPSAPHRFENLKIAAQLMNQPRILLLGLGYNFLPVLQSGYGVRGFDASLANLFVTLGLPLGLLVTGALFRWIKQATFAASKAHPIFADMIVAYLVASVPISFINNLLFFTLFLWMVIPLLCFFHMEGRPETSPRVNPKVS